MYTPAFSGKMIDVRVDKRGKKVHEEKIESVFSDVYLLSGNSGNTHCHRDDHLPARTAGGKGAGGPDERQHAEHGSEGDGFKDWRGPEAGRQAGHG